MKKNVIIGMLVILVLLLVVAGEIFYLTKVRPRVTLQLQGLTDEEKEITSIENSTSDLEAEGALSDEIDGAFLEVFDIMSSDKAINEESLASEEALADISTDLNVQTTDENSFQEMDQTLNELSF